MSARTDRIAEMEAKISDAATRGKRLPKTEEKLATFRAMTDWHYDEGIANALASLEPGHVSPLAGAATLPGTVAAKRSYSSLG